VTETEWLEATEAADMLWVVYERPQTRKLRLFACACCRRIWHLLPTVAQEAVEAAERYADRLIKDNERRQAERAVLAELARSDSMALKAVGCACVRSRERDTMRWVIPNAANAAGQAASQAAQAETPPRRGYPAQSAASDAERAAYPALARCVFGNPFRPAAVDPAVLGWNDGTLPRLAQSAYDERRLPAGTLDEARLAVLADALEEAGCADEAILSHLRGPSPHVRGCWVVDLILGKE
jgi:hypothetical protein